VEARETPGHSTALAWIAPNALDFARTQTHSYRGVGVAAADFSTSIHRFGLRQEIGRAVI
jgi:hypothetical protein